MPDYEEVKEEISIPPGTGVAGCLKAVEGILELPRVQTITISKGKITYQRFKLPEEKSALQIDLTTLTPSHVIRNADVEEYTAVSVNAAVVVAQLFAKVAADGLNPIAFVGGTTSWFPGWHLESTDVSVRREEMYGLPFLRDTQIPDEALIMCAAYSRKGKLVDTAKAYKVTCLKK